MALIQCAKGCYTTHIIFELRIESKSNRSTPHLFIFTISFVDFCLHFFLYFFINIQNFLEIALEQRPFILQLQIKVFSFLDFVWFAIAVR